MLNSRRTSGLAPTDVIRKARWLVRDVPLSTAALTSARFPFVSPHGTIKNLARETIDRIVDGGYFESNGALTAVDIINAIGRLRVVDVEKLREGCAKREIAADICNDNEAFVGQEMGSANMFVIQISNDPEPGRCVRVSDRKREIVSNSFDPSANIPMPNSSPWKMFGTLRSIVDGVASARVARGTHASEVLAYHTDDDEKGYFAWRSMSNPGFVHLRVCPPDLSSGAARTWSRARQVGDLSMSWWLSQTTQSYLDEQLCEDGNVEALSKALLVMSRRFNPNEEAAMRGLRTKYESMVRTSLNCGCLVSCYEPITKPMFRIWRGSETGPKVRSCASAEEIHAAGQPR